MTGRFTLKEFKSVLKHQIDKYPSLYDGEEWVNEIFSYDETMDNRNVHTEWAFSGIIDEGEKIMKVSSFVVL